jgi:diketogulonate reductase-like aldo/keto reductase
MLPIPGTSSVHHLEENTAAAGIALTDAEFDALAALLLTHSGTRSVGGQQWMPTGRSRWADQRSTRSFSPPS